jgi:hypothetical protein
MKNQGFFFGADFLSAWAAAAVIISIKEPFTAILLSYFPRLVRSVLGFDAFAITTKIQSYFNKITNKILCRNK